jgi:hypothetical protein
VSILSCHPAAPSSGLALKIENGQTAVCTKINTPPPAEFKINLFPQVTAASALCRASRPSGRPKPTVPAPRPAPRPVPYPRPASASARYRCGRCGRVYCVCPRLLPVCGWVTPGKGTQPIRPGTVRPPLPSQLPPARKGGRR